MAEHSTLTDPNLHEPKGASGASVDTVYIADGSGSGSWNKPSAENITISDDDGNLTATNVEDALSEIYKVDTVVSGVLDDVSEEQTLLIPIPFDCTVDSIVMILSGTITAADSVITVSRSDSASLGDQTISQSGSAEGTTFIFTPSDNNEFTFENHKYIKLVSSGGSTGSQKLYCQVHLTRS